MCLWAEQLWRQRQRGFFKGTLATPGPLFWGPLSPAHGRRVTRFLADCAQRYPPPLFKQGSLKPALSDMTLRAPWSSRSGKHRVMESGSKYLRREGQKGRRREEVKKEGGMERRKNPIS